MANSWNVSGPSPYMRFCPYAGYLSSTRQLHAVSMLDHVFDRFYGEASQPVRHQPDYIRVVLASPVSQAKRYRMVAWRTVTTVVAVPAPNYVVVRKCLLNHLATSRFLRASTMAPNPS